MPFFNYTFLFLIAFCLLFSSCNTKINKAIDANQIELNDGIYLIEKRGDAAKDILPISDHEKIIVFNKEFIEKTEQDSRYLVVNTNEFAPLTIKT